MTRDELNYVLKLLERIKPKDEHVEKAIAYVNKDLAHYNARKGQLKELYEADYPRY